MSSLQYNVTDGVCVLRLNHPPVNSLTLAVLEELLAAVRRANADGAVRGIVLAGDDKRFSAGADVGLFRDLTDSEGAVRLSRVFQEAFHELEDSAKTVVAAVAGGTMGGALELAMACHFRVCDRGARFSLPEVNLGINPGAGGTQRLPRLIGVEAALKMLLSGKPVNAAEALELRLVDDVCDASELIARASRCLDGSEPCRTRDRADKISDRAANEAAFAQAREQVAGTRPELIAPAEILGAVRTGVEESFAAGQQAEQEAFARCMETLATRNKIYVFFASSDTAKAPDLDGVPTRPVNRVAVVGMGSMGAGIAQAVIQAGLPVVVTDENPESLERGGARIRESLQKRAAQGKLSPERVEAMLDLLSITTDLEEIARADIVIEAVFEDVAVKQAVLGAVEGLAPEHTIVASNTSTISLEVLARPLRRPERFIGLHFFNPAQHMPLLEVIHHHGSAAGVIATSLRFAKAIRKTPALVRNREGFIVNRILVPYLAEAFRLLEEGADAGEIDRAMVEFGFPMGPMTLSDMAGLDILVHASNLLTEAFPRHGSISPVASTMLERGLLGQKRGAGVYRYVAGDRRPHPNAETDEIVAETRRGNGIAARSFTAEDITQRLVMRMVAEAFYVLEEGIVRRETDVDAAMALGAGFPDFRGGVVKYARDRGLESVSSELEELVKQNGERYASCSWLKEQKGY